jgi:hypothetical protein
MKEVDTPEQTVLFPVMLQTGNAFTVIISELQVAVLLQASVAVHMIV